MSAEMIVQIRVKHPTDTSEFKFALPSQNQPGSGIYWRQKFHDFLKTQTTFSVRLQQHGASDGLPNSGRKGPTTRRTRKRG